MDPKEDSDDARRQRHNGNMSQKAAPVHPCMTCGACCAFFRVEFYWREANREDTANAVPAHLVEDLTPQTRCMKGTSSKHNPKCVALKGRIGESVQCSIYENRSSVCRKFTASYEDGQQNVRCDEARAKHGLRPLRRSDWPSKDIDAEA